MQRRLRSVHPLLAFVSFLSRRREHTAQRGVREISQLSYRGVQTRPRRRSELRLQRQGQDVGVTCGGGWEGQDALVRGYGQEETGQDKCGLWGRSERDASVGNMRKDG